MTAKVTGAAEKSRYVSGVGGPVAESSWWTSPGRQRIALALTVAASGALALWAYRRFGIAGSLALVAAWLAFHLVMRARQRRLEAKLGALLERLPPEERLEAIRTLPPDLRDEVKRALAAERRP